MQIRAPSSITDWFHTTEAARCSGSSERARRVSAAVRDRLGSPLPEKRRACTRRMLVSITHWRSPKAKAETAAAV